MGQESAVHPIPHPIIQLCVKAIQRQVEARFARWLPEKTIDAFLYSLEPFASQRPLCYFDEDAVDTCLAIFEEDPALTLDALQTHGGPVTHAILSLLRGGMSWELESALSIQTPKQITELDRVWHPEYQRYIEHIYNNLFTVVLEILGRNDGKDYIDQTLANRIQRLVDKGYPGLTVGADATVRNAISHGGVRFEHDGITYCSSKQTVDLKPRQFTSHLDGLADVSSASVVAMLLFLCRNPGQAIASGYGRLPLGVRFLLLKPLSQYRGFRLESISESQTGQEKVLNLYCTSRTKARMVHRFDGLTAATQALVLGGGGYDLISVSIDCGGGVPTYSPYKVAEMTDALQPGAPSSLMAKILDPGRELLWYDTSVLARKLYALRCTASAVWANTKADVVREWRQSGLRVLSTRYRLRFDPVSGNKSVGRVRRAEGHAVLAAGETATQELVEMVARHAARRLRRKFLRSADLTGQQTLLARHPKYVWLKIHCADGRFRELSARGIGDSHLLAVSEWIHRAYRNKPIVVKEPLRRGGHRIRHLVPRR